MMHVHIKQLRLYAFHGLDEGEDVVGGEYEIDLFVSYKPKQVPVTNLNQTIDYTSLLAIVKQHMLQPTHLLETLATQIASEIFAKFPIAADVSISIYKLHPPIRNFEGKVGVSFQLKRNDKQ